MTSLLKTGIEILNSNAACAFGGLYAINSGFQYLGFAQSINPLTTPTLVASNKILEGLIDLSCKNITKLQHFHQLRSEEKEIDAKLVEHKIIPTYVSLGLIDKEDPDLLIEVLDLIKRKEEIEEELKPLKVVSKIATFTLLYFRDAATTLVTSALTSSVTYLPPAALTLASSLSITPMSLVIGMIFASGFIIKAYNERQQRAVI